MTVKRIIFAGTPDFSVAPLQALLDSEHQVVAVYTQPDRPAGRGRSVSMSPVKNLALEHQIPVFQPENFKAEADILALKNLQADLMVVVAYGLLLPKAILDAPVYGCINIHASLLPRWRGAAPIQRAILAADKESGVTLMQMDEGLDTGDMLLKKSCPLNQQTTGGELHDELQALGSTALLELLPDLFAKTLKPIKQDDHLATYAKKLSKQEALIDWSLDAKTLHHQICAFNPWPVSHTTLNGKNVRIWQSKYDSTVVNGIVGTVISADAEGIKVVTGKGILNIQALQVSGKKRMTSANFINGRQIIGDIFG